jgi:hypothetical protein
MWVASGERLNAPRSNIDGPICPTEGWIAVLLGAAGRRCAPLVVACTTARFVSSQRSWKSKKKVQYS